jgi:mRNA interferase YafQ
VKRLLLRSNAFIGAAKKIVKKDPQLADDIEATLELLAEDALNPRLKTHKLKGILKGSMACSVGYNTRIIFKIVQYHSSEAILLETMGTHDEVY